VNSPNIAAVLRAIGTAAARRADEKESKKKRETARCVDAEVTRFAVSLAQCVGLRPRESNL
jgi:hypothetical protein